MTNQFAELEKSIDFAQNLLCYFQIIAVSVMTNHVWSLGAKRITVMSICSKISQHYDVHPDLLDYFGTAVPI